MFRGTPSTLHTDGLEGDYGIDQFLNQSPGSALGIKAQTDPELDTTTERLSRFSFTTSEEDGDDSAPAAAPGAPGPTLTHTTRSASSAPPSAPVLASAPAATGAVSSMASESTPTVVVPSSYPPLHPQYVTFPKTASTWSGEVTSAPSGGGISPSSSGLGLSPTHTSPTHYVRPASNSYGEAASYGDSASYSDSATFAEGAYGTVYPDPASEFMASTEFFTSQGGRQLAPHTEPARKSMPHRGLHSRTPPAPMPHAAAYGGQYGDMGHPGARGSRGAPHGPSHAPVTHRGGEPTHISPTSSMSSHSPGHRTSPYADPAYADPAYADPAYGGYPHGYPTAQHGYSAPPRGPPAPGPSYTSPHHGPPAGGHPGPQRGGHPAPHTGAPMMQVMPGMYSNAFYMPNGMMAVPIPVQVPMGGYEAPPQHSQYGGMQYGAPSHPQHYQYAAAPAPAPGYNSYAPQYAPHGHAGHAGPEAPPVAYSAYEKPAYRAAPPAHSAAPTGHYGGGNRGGGRHRGSSDSRYSGSSGRRGGQPRTESIKLSIDELRGKVLPMSKDQNGCRLLQQQLDGSDSALFDLVMNESLPHIVEMMVDPFGNYLFQKLVNQARPAVRENIVRMVTEGEGSSPLVSAALGLHGTRSVQKIVSTCNSPAEVTMIVKALKDHVVRLATDTNGNHVIQRCLQHLSSQQCQFIIDAAKENCLRVSQQRHGCCVIQRCIDAGTEVQKEGLIAEIVKHALGLMQDPFGNYVVQYVLAQGTSSQAHALMTQLLGHLPQLAVQKFSSNVVEKCLRRADDALRSALIDELCLGETLGTLCADQYGNYVVQQAVASANSTQGATLIKALRPHERLLENTSGGRRILTKLTKRFPELWLA